MKITLVACSLNPHSLSTQLAIQSAQIIQTLSPEHSIEVILLKDFPLPFANGSDGSAYEDPSVKILHDKLAQSRGIILASPIYNYDVSAACKNLIELTGFKYKNILSGDAWQGKVIGFIGSCGSLGSYIAPMGLFNSLFLDFKCHILPHFIMASAGDFLDGNPSGALTSRLVKFSRNFLAVGQALSASSAR